MIKVMSSVFNSLYICPITVYSSANVLKNYRTDVKSNVVCFSCNIFLSHLKKITVYSNANDIILSLVIFTMPTSVNL